MILSAQAAIQRAKERLNGVEVVEMDKRKVWLIGISTLTTFIIAFGSSIITAVTESHAMPSEITWLVASLGAAVVAAKKVEDYLKSAIEKDQAVQKKEFEMQVQNGTGNGSK